MAVPAISVVIPVYNSAADLDRCLQALSVSSFRDFEVIVVDDASTDASPAVALRHGALVIPSPGRGGPARARNAGVRHASAPIVFFVDADVCVAPEALDRVHLNFQRNPQPDAVIGSYDDQPADPGFLSRYKNLQHHYVHQQGNADAGTFWTGCGAIRRDVFLSLGGFDESYRRPCIEDIELGLRLRAAGGRILLDHALQVKHLKRWTWSGLLRTDVFDRAIPWARLMLRSGSLPNDLNTSWDQRLAAVLTLAIVTAPIAWLARLLSPGMAAAIACVALIALVLINRGFYSLLAQRGGLWFALRSIPQHMLYYLYSGVALVIAVVMHAAGRDHRA